MSKKSTKIVQAQATVKLSLRRLERKLSKLLTAKELTSLESTFSMLRSAHRMLGAEILRLDPSLVSRLDTLESTVKAPAKLPKSGK